MNDDLEDDVVDVEEEGFDEFSSQKPSIADTIRKSPALKLGVVGAAVAVVVAVSILFGGEQIQTEKSALPEGNDLTSAPGAQEEVSPAYKEAIEEQNESNLEEALKTGQSAIPTPMETTDTRLQVPETQEEVQQDPLQRWRVLQEERIERELQAREEDIAPVTVLNAEEQKKAVDDLANVMMKQMETVLQSRNTTNNFVTKTYATIQDDEGDTGRSYRSGGSAAEPRSRRDSGFDAMEAPPEIILPAGKIYYAQMLLEANSDVPNVVMAQIVSGPLKGWKALGSFEVMEDIDMLAITFTHVVNDDGKQLDVSAVMLDPATSLPAMRTDVDYRLLRRVVYPAAASFIEGFAQAMSETGQTVIGVSSDSPTVVEAEPEDEQEVSLGAEEAASVIAEFLEEQGDVPVRIIIEAGTPMGIFFTENVIDTGDGF